MPRRTINLELAIIALMILIATIAIAAPRLVGRCDGVLQFHNEESQFTGQCDWIEQF